MKVSHLQLQSDPPRNAIFDRVVSVAAGLPAIDMTKNGPLRHFLILLRYNQDRTPTDFVFNIRFGFQWTDMATDSHAIAGDAASMELGDKWTAVFVAKLGFSSDIEIPSELGGYIVHTPPHIKCQKPERGTSHEFAVGIPIPATQIGVICITSVAGNYVPVNATDSDLSFPSNLDPHSL